MWIHAIFDFTVFRSHDIVEVGYKWMHVYFRTDLLHLYSYKKKKINSSSVCVIIQRYKFASYFDQVKIELQYIHHSIKNKMALDVRHQFKPPNSYFNYFYIKISDWSHLENSTLCIIGVSCGSLNLVLALLYSVYCNKLTS